jgi:hypothetical protein
MVTSACMLWWHLLFDCYGSAYALEPLVWPGPCRDPHAPYISHGNIRVYALVAFAL